MWFSLGEPKAYRNCKFVWIDFLSFESDIIWVNINYTDMILIAYNFKIIYDFTNFLVYICTCM